MLVLVLAWLLLLLLSGHGPLSTCLPLCENENRALGPVGGGALLLPAAGPAGGAAPCPFTNPFDADDEPFVGSSSPPALGRWFARLRGPVGGGAPNLDELGAVGG